VSEIAISYALLTVGLNPEESLIMRHRMADAALELGMQATAEAINETLHSVKA
jgi:hypothetical protein